MASSGSQGRGATNSGSKSYDFASDDILCSYEDYGNQDGNNGSHSDPSGAANSAMEFHKSRMARSSVFPASTYSPPEESSFHQDVISTVENTVKKYTDNLMRFLEGVSSRLSQLELYCYNLDKSIGEMRSELVRDHGESGSKLKNLEKHIQEVHRSVQILRDKQELADTQKELAKLQLAQKDSSSTGNTPRKEERASQTALEDKKSDNSSDGHDQQLALVVPQQVAPQPSLPARPVDHQQQQPPLPPPQSSMPPQSMSQVQGYYLPPQQMINMPPSQQPQTQYQIQDHSRIPPQPSQSQVNQTPQVQSLPPYQQQWIQQQQQQQQQPVQPPQQPLMQPQIRTSSQLVYSSYVPTQSNQNPSPEVPPPNSMPMQVSYVGASLPGSEAIPPYGYGATTGRPIQPQHNIKIGYGPQPGDGYMPSGPRPALPPGNAYMMFDGEGGRTHQPHFQQSGYPPNTIPSQNPQRMPNANMGGGPQSMRGHPYNELIEKLVSMGYRGDHVVGIIQRLEESGQPIDFNTVLDRLNGHSSGGGSQRGWSG